jgi:hypothetical protein
MLIEFVTKFNNDVKGTYYEAKQSNNTVAWNQETNSYTRNTLIIVITVMEHVTYLHFDYENG